MVEIPQWNEDEIVPNLENELIRRMAEQNHLPEDVWGSYGPPLMRCVRCHRKWPCATRRQLDEWEAERVQLHLEIYQDFDPEKGY